MFGRICLPGIIALSFFLSSCGLLRIPFRIVGGVAGGATHATKSAYQKSKNSARRRAEKRERAKAEREKKENAKAAQSDPGAPDAYSQALPGEDMSNGVINDDMPSLNEEWPPREWPDSIDPSGNE